MVSKVKPRGLEMFISNIRSRIFTALLFYAAVLATLGLFGCGGGATGEEDKGLPTLVGPATAEPTPDTTPPTVSDTSPSNAATGVALNASISATFSEAMSNSSLSATSFTLARTAGGAPVAATVVISGNTALLVPSANLAGSTQYTATITTAATDAAGNGLAGNYTWKFTTGAASDTTPPTI